MIKKIFSSILISLCILAFLLFAIHVLVSSEKYIEEYSCELEEVKDKTYAIYHSVSSSIPADNYEVITICYNGQIHTFKGKVNINQTNDTPHAKIMKRAINNADNITIYVPKGTVEFAENVGVR